MDKLLFEKLYEDGLISDASLQNINKPESLRFISVFNELRILLYTGILLLTTGISVLVYKHIDSISHQVLLASIAIACFGCFYWCFKNKAPFSFYQVNSPKAYFDYVVLLACLLLLTFIAYIQFEYTVFGNRYGLALFIPMLILFYIAYVFDNIGILGLAITNLAAWAGIAVTPTKILLKNDFHSGTLIFTAISLGIFLCALGFISIKRKFKPHFSFSYNNFGINILFIASIAGMFHFENWWLLWFAVIAMLSIAVYKKALHDHSFYFLLLIAIYGYIALSYVVIKFIFEVGRMEKGGSYLVFLYFITS